MANLKQVEAAFMKADAAGDTQAAKVLAGEVRRLRAEESVPSTAPPTAPADDPAPKWSDLPGNILPSAGRFVGGIANAVMHPIDTISGVADAAAGGLRNITPAPIRNFIDRADSPENIQRITKTADSVGTFYKDRYGGAGNIKNTLITDPVGAAADVSTVLTGGSGLAKLGGLTKTGNALQTAANATNPLSAVAPIARGVGKVGGAAAKNVLGVTTGVGGENIAQAFKAGVGKDKAFLDNITGKADITDVLDNAKQGIEEMGRAKSAEYTKNMASVSNDKTVLSFAGIDSAITDAGKIGNFKGQTLNPKAAEAVGKIEKLVADWKALDPAEFHTPAGLDALKKQIGGVMEALPFEEKTARLAAGKVYTAVKSEIVKQAPVYAKTMKAYSEQSEQIHEIERALSLGKKSAADTAMRKLQSLSRNNVNTNYGNRLALAQTLEAEGGVSLLPSIAGQAMNSWTPRGLAGPGGGLLGLAALGTGNAASLPLLAFQSPKAVGLGAYGLGRAAGVAGKGVSALGGQRNKLAALLAEEAQQAQQDKEKQ